MTGGFISLRYLSADTTCITMDRASLSGIVLCYKKTNANVTKLLTSEKRREKNIVNPTPMKFLAILVNANFHQFLLPHIQYGNTQITKINELLMWRRNPLLIINDYLRCYETQNLTFEALWTMLTLLIPAIDRILDGPMSCFLIS